MSVSRRGFLQGLGVGRTSHASAFIAARGHEELVAEAMQQQGRQGGGMRRPALPPGVEAIRISSNENPLGPGKAAIDAILGKFPEANRYPFNSTPLDADLEILLAKLNAAKRENVVLGVGSQELLKNAARVFLSPTKHLVIPSPTYGDPAGFAQNMLKVTVKTAPVTDRTFHFKAGTNIELPSANCDLTPTSMVSATSASNRSLTPAMPLASATAPTPVWLKPPLRKPRLQPPNKVTLSVGS